MQIVDMLQRMTDTILSHVGVKVRYSVQAQNRSGDWYDLNQAWDTAKRDAYSVSRTVEGARAWKKRAEAAWARNGVPAPRLRIVRSVTTFDVVA